MRRLHASEEPRGERRDVAHGVGKLREPAGFPVFRVTVKIEHDGLKYITGFECFTWVLREIGGKFVDIAYMFVELIPH